MFDHTLAHHLFHLVKKPRAVCVHPALPRGAAASERSERGGLSLGSSSRLHALEVGTEIQVPTEIVASQSCELGALLSPWAEVLFFAKMKRPSPEPTVARERDLYLAHWLSPGLRRSYSASSVASMLSPFLAGAFCCPPPRSFHRQPPGGERPGRETRG